VLVIDGDRAHFTDDRCTQIAQTLKRIIKCADVEIEMIETGSVVLYLQVSSDAQIESYRHVAEELSHAENIKVLGFGEWRDFERQRGLDQEFLSASLELIQWPKHLPNGEWLERAEFTTLKEKVVDNSSSATVILGGPGTGKTSLLSAVAQSFVGKDETGEPRSGPTAVLAIKADSIPTWVKTDNDLRVSLGLSGLLVESVRAAARWKPILLIVDQLDALASNLDLRSERLNLLLNAIRRLSGTSNVHIIASARLFEFEHDARLRATEAESLALELPPWHQVAEVLQANSIDPERLSEKQRTLVRTPQALRILLEIASNPRAEEATIPDTYSAMLDRFWVSTVLDSPDGATKERLAYRLAEHLAQEEALWLPASKFSDDHVLLEALERSGVLARAQGGMLIGFSHQTLFEHALSRSFVKAQGGLSQYVLERQTSLFVRPKLLVGLKYLRETDQAAYKRELLALWHFDSLRTHLKLLLIDFLGHLPDPTNWEALLLDPVLNGDSIHKGAAWRAVPNSPGWFQFLKRAALPAIMRDKQLHYLAFPVLNFAWEFAHSDVAALIKDNWLPEVDFDDRTFDVLSRCTRWDANVLHIALQILKRSKIAAIWVDQVVSTVAVYDTKLAIEILRAALDRRLEVAIKEASKASEEALPEGVSQAEQLEWLLKRNQTAANQELFDRDHDWQSVPEIAKQDATHFLSSLWPFYLAAFSLVARDSYGPSYRRDNLHFDFDFDDGEISDPRERYRRAPPLLDAIAEAVHEAALHAPDNFKSWLSDAARSDLGRVHELIVLGFLSNPEAWAQEAFRYLLGDPRRLMNGSFSDRFAFTKALISGVTPFLTHRQQKAIETTILKFHPFDNDGDRSPQSRFQVHKWTRLDRVRLLKSIPDTVISGKSRKLIQEEERALGPAPERDVSGGGVQWIGSPISKGQMTKAKDEDLLSILAQIDDKTGWSHPREFMKGGSVQLAREFAEFALDQPDRAIGIIRRLSPDTQERVAAYGIEALATGAANGRTRDVSLTLPAASEIEKLILELNTKGFGKEEYRETVARAVARFADGDHAVSDDSFGNSVSLAQAAGDYSDRRPSKRGRGKGRRTDRELSLVLRRVLDRSPRQLPSS
jgi:hypothetical protein